MAGICDAYKHVTSVVSMQNDGGIMTRVSSFSIKGVDQPASPLPPPPTSNLRSTPFDWGSPRATAGATSQRNAGSVISEGVSEAPSHSAGTGGYISSIDPSRTAREVASSGAMFATVSGEFSGVRAGNGHQCC